MMREIAIILTLTGLITSIAAEKKYLLGSVENKAELVENAEFAPKSTRIQAIRQCGAWRYYFCMRPLINNLKDADIDIRVASIRNLGVLRRQEAVAHLLPIIKDEGKSEQDEAAVKNETEEQKKARLEKEKKEKIEAQAASLVALGYIKDASVVPEIEKFLSNENEELRRTAAHSLGLLNKESSADALKTQLSSEKSTRVQVELLKSLILITGSTDYQAQLFSRLKDTDNWVRFFAADALLDLHLKSALQDLEEALQVENDEWVRERMFKAYRECLYLP